MTIATYRFPWLLLLLLSATAEGRRGLTARPPLRPVADSSRRNFRCWMIFAGGSHRRHHRPRPGGDDVAVPPPSRRGGSSVLTTRRPSASPFSSPSSSFLCALCSYRTGHTCSLAPILATHQAPPLSFYLTMILILFFFLSGLSTR